ncbi:MAG: hypothetical protein ACK4Y9_00860 [Hyphomonas sp.]
MKLFFKFLGIALVLAGVALFWTPVPIGAVLILMGAALLIAHSDTAQNWILHRRKLHPSVDRWMIRSGKYLPASMARVVHKTHPDQDQGHSAGQRNG